ncbi:MAG: hypothetical protein ACI4JC_09865 [Faecalibacterium sp.]
MVMYQILLEQGKTSSEANEESSAPVGSSSVRGRFLQKIFTEIIELLRLPSYVDFLPSWENVKILTVFSATLSFRTKTGASRYAPTAHGTERRKISCPTYPEEIFFAPRLLAHWVPPWLVC